MALDLPENLSIEKDGYATYRPRGRYTFDQTVGMIDKALVYCRDSGIRGLLVNISEVTGFPPPTTIQRLDFASKWADTAGGKVALSLIARPELIDPDKIGVTMARNRGLFSDVFSSDSEPEAIEWILARVK